MDYILKEMPYYHTYLLAISQQILSEADIQNTGFFRFQGLFSYMLEIDSQNGPSGAPV